MKFKFCILILLSGFVSTVLAQDIRVEAPSSVYANSSFTVKVMISGGNYKDYKDPTFNGLNVQGRGTMYQNINGKVSKGFNYTVYAPQEGSATVGPACCTINGETYTTAAKTIRVEPARPRSQQQQRRNSFWDDDEEDPFAAMQQMHQQMMQQMGQMVDPYQQRQSQMRAPSKDDKNSIFAKISINNANPYKGEQVILTYKLYTLVDFRMTSGFHAPEKKGFWAENLLLNQQVIRPQEEILNGRRYITYELGREAIYAQEDGSLKIDVMDLPIQAIFYTATPIQVGFFTIQASTADPQQITLRTNPLNVHVKSLPSGPQEFGGAVGHFDIKGGIDHAETRANEAVTYSLTVSGSGNLTLIDEPVVNFPKAFETYDPEVEDKITRTLNGISGSRTYKWVLIPRSEGKYEIPAFSFVYFDPKSGSYVKKTVPATTISVAKGDPKLMQNASSGANKKLRSDINYIKTKDISPTLGGAPEPGSTWFWIAIAGCFVAAVAAVICGKRRQEANKDIAGVRLRRATREAQKRLKRAEKYLKSGDDNRFYEEVYKAIWGCIADKFNIELSKLSSETVQGCLNEKNVSAEKQDLINDTLRDVDFARFAPGDSSSKKHTIYEKALVMIRSLSFVVLLVLLPFVGWSQENDSSDVSDRMPSSSAPVAERMVAANNAYRAAKYQQAGRIYQELVEEGYESHTLYYNLANAMFRIGEYPQSILYYEKALRLTPNDSDTKENLELAYSKVTNDIQPLPKFFVTQWYHNAVRACSTTVWLVWVLVAFAMMLAVFVWFALTGEYRIRKITFSVGILLLIAVVVFSINAAASSRLAKQHCEAVVMSDVVGVKGSPDAGSSDKFELHGGNKVAVEDQIDSWVKVVAADGNNGWIEQSVIERI